MRDHLKTLGWLYVAGGAEGGALIGGIGFAIALFIAALAVPSLVCGWALLTYKPWARTLGIILSVLQLASFPMGTLLGGYGLWVLLNDDSRRMLEAGDPRFRQVGAGW